MKSRVILLSVLLIGVVDVSGAQATYQQGTWAAQSSNGATLGGTWTAVPDTTNGTVTGSWTLVDPQGKTRAAGGWSASKSPDEWIGNWRAVADGSNADSVGTWSASVDLKRSAGFADLFKLALKSIVSGRWRLGPYAGTWSISAQAGATTTTSSATDSKTPEMSRLLVDFRAATHPFEEKEILGRWLLVKAVDTEEFLTGRAGPEHTLADERGVRDTTSGHPYHWELTVTRDNQGKLIGASRTTWTAPETSRLDFNAGEITFSKDYGGNSVYRYRCRLPAADRMICIFDTPDPGHAVEFRKFGNE